MHRQGSEPGLDIDEEGGYGEDTRRGVLGEGEGEGYHYISESSPRLILNRISSSEIIIRVSLIVVTVNVSPAIRESWGPCIHSAPSTNCCPKINQRYAVTWVVHTTKDKHEFIRLSVFLPVFWNRTVLLQGTVAFKSNLSYIAVAYATAISRYVEAEELCCQVGCK